MNDKNYDYLDKQIFFTGFGDKHDAELKEKMLSGKPNFSIPHMQDFGKDITVATLQFNKGTEGDNYFFNRYSLHLKNEQHPEAIKQTFYINHKEDPITLKEGYNLLSGRSIFKEFTNKEGEKYEAWAMLNFKATDNSGNYELRKFNKNYGFNLENTLAKYPIKELKDELTNARLIESLQRGNRQQITLQDGVSEKKVFIEAAPRFHSLNFFDSNNVPIKNVQQVHREENNTQSEKQDQQQGKSAKQTVKNEGDEAEPGGRKKRHRRGQSIK